MCFQRCPGILSPVRNKNTAHEVSRSGWLTGLLMGSSGQEDPHQNKEPEPMTSPFEVDPEALQTLITALNTYERDFENLQNQLYPAYNNFDSGFMSPQKTQLEQTWSYVQSYAKEFTIKIEELQTGLRNLQQQAQTVEQVTF